MASLVAIRDGLAENLRTVPGIQVSAHRLTDPTPPTAQVYPDDPFIEYDVTGSRGLDAYKLIVELFVSENLDVGDQMALDALIDEMKAAMELDRKLGGACSDLIVTEAGGYGEETSVSGAVLGCRFSVEAYA